MKKVILTALCITSLGCASSILAAGVINGYITNKSGKNLIVSTTSTSVSGLGATYKNYPTRSISASRTGRFKAFKAVAKDRDSDQNVNVTVAYKAMKGNRLIGECRVYAYRYKNAWHTHWSGLRGVGNDCDGKLTANVSTHKSSQLNIIFK